MAAKTQGRPVSGLQPIPLGGCCGPKKTSRPGPALELPICSTLSAPTLQPAPPNPALQRQKKLQIGILVRAVPPHASPALWIATKVLPAVRKTAPHWRLLEAAPTASYISDPATNTTARKIRAKDVLISTGAPLSRARAAMDRYTKVSGHIDEGPRRCRASAQLHGERASEPRRERCSEHSREIRPTWTRSHLWRSSLRESARAPAVIGDGVCSPASSPTTSAKRSSCHISAARAVLATTTKKPSSAPKTSKASSPSPSSTNPASTASPSPPATRRGRRFRLMDREPRSSRPARETAPHWRLLEAAPFSGLLN